MNTHSPPSPPREPVEPLHREQYCCPKSTAAFMSDRLCRPSWLGNWSARIGTWLHENLTHFEHEESHWSRQEQGWKRLCSARCGACRPAQLLCSRGPWVAARWVPSTRQRSGLARL